MSKWPQLMEPRCVGQGQTLKVRRSSLEVRSRAAALVECTPPGSTEVSTARGYPLPACQALCLLHCLAPSLRLG